MKIDNKKFWEKKEIIRTQDAVKSASKYEKFLFDSAISRLAGVDNIKSVNIYGCGTGRDIKIIDSILKPNSIVASDISENMINSCLSNLDNWNVNAEVEVFVSNAVDFRLPNENFELVTLLNSMLTYVANREDRLKIYKNSYDCLKDKGVIIGTVHHQIGRPAKTWYFKLKRLLIFIPKYKIGNKNTGFKGYKIAGYYYDKNWLYKDLYEVGFKNIELYSLSDFFMKIGNSYDKSKGYNQLIFIASK